MTTKRKIPKSLPIVAGVILLVAVGLVVAEWWLERKTREMIGKGIEGVQVEVGTVRVDLLSRTVTLRDVALHADGKALLPGDSSLRSLHITLDELSAAGLGYENRKERKSLQVRRLRINAPRIVIDRDKSAAAGAVADTAAVAAARQAGLKIGRFDLTNGELQYNLWEGEEVDTYSVSGLSLSGKNLNTDSLANGTLSGQKLRLSADRVGYSYNGHAFLAEADTIVANVEERTFSVASVRLTPQYEKDEFALRAKGHPDWTQVSTGPIAGSGIDYAALLAGKRVEMESLQIAGGAVASYKNRQVWQQERIKPLFSQTLQRLPFGLSVGKTEIGPVDVTYEELALDGTRPGVVTFTGLSATFDGLTNIPAADRAFHTMTATGKLMGEADVLLTIAFPIDSLTDRFDARGHIGAFDLMAMNRALEPLMQAEVRSGRLSGLDFRIEGSTTRSLVEMTMLYDDLSLSVVKPQDGRYKERKAVSLFIDTFLIKSHNPDRRGTRTGSGETDRNLYRSQYNYLWRSLLPGIKKSVM